MAQHNLVPRVFALGERNTLVWPGHVTRGFCVKWRIVYYNQEQKLSRQPHKCPPHPQFNVVWMTEKRKFNPLFPTLIMGAGGRPTYFKMAKNVKSLIIFARDCLRWSCLGVSCPKFEILPKSSDQDDMRLTYFNQLTESFLSPKM